MSIAKFITIDFAMGVKYSIYYRKTIHFYYSNYNVPLAERPESRHIMVNLVKRYLVYLKKQYLCVVTGYMYRFQHAK